MFTVSGLLFHDDPLVWEQLIPPHAENTSSKAFQILKNAKKAFGSEQTMPTGPPNEHRPSRIFEVVMIRMVHVNIGG